MHLLTPVADPKTENLPTPHDATLGYTALTVSRAEVRQISCRLENLAPKQFSNVFKMTKRSWKIKNLEKCEGLDFPNIANCDYIKNETAMIT